MSDNGSVKEILIAEERPRFEDAVYAHYKERQASGKLNSEGEGDGSRESLLWKQPNGEYGVLMLNAAWWGWKAAKGLA